MGVIPQEERAMFLLSWLRTRGFNVKAKDGKLIINPASKLTEAAVEEIKNFKAALLRLLTGDSTWLLPEHWTDQERDMMATLAAGGWSWWRENLAAEFEARRTGH